MSVPKSNRNQSKMEFFDFAYKIEENIIKYVLADFGTTRSYRSLRIFCARAKMEPEDGALLEYLKEKYNLDLETSYPEFILSHFRDLILSKCDEIMSCITKAYTIYPNSVFEYNNKRDHQTDAISACYELKHVLQICIRIFDSQHMEKFVWLVDDIDKEVEYIKQWRKDGNKIRKECYINDEKRRANAIAELQRRNAKRQPDNVFLEKIMNTTGIDNQLDKKTMLYNMEHAEISVDGYGRLRSSLYIPAIYFVDSSDENKITGFGF